MNKLLALLIFALCAVNSPLFSMSPEGSKSEPGSPDATVMEIESEGKSESESGEKYPTIRLILNDSNITVPVIYEADEGLNIALLQDRRLSGNSINGAFDLQKSPIFIYFKNLYMIESDTPNSITLLEFAGDSSYGVPTHFRLKQQVDTHGVENVWIQLSIKQEDPQITFHQIYSF